MTALHIAYSYTVVPKCNGCVITLREKLKVVPDLTLVPHPTDPRSKPKVNPFAFLVLEEEVEDPREVIFDLASSNTVARVSSFMDSLTDDLIFNQWFRVKVHKKKSKRGEDVSA